MEKKKNILILVPHQDDETNLVGNVMEVLTRDEVYVLYSSIDTNPEAIEVTSKNLKKFGLGDNVTLINDDGSQALKDISDIDIAIVGGSGRQLENILDVVDEKLNSKGRIIITAILVDTKVEAINKLKDLGYNPKIMEVNVSNGRVLDRGVLMISENPIAIITAKKR